MIALSQEAQYRYFSIFFNLKVGCVFSLESPHRGDSNEYIQHTIFNIKKNHKEYIYIKKIKEKTLNYPKSAAVGFSHGPW